MGCAAALDESARSGRAHSQSSDSRRVIGGADLPSMAEALGSDRRARRCSSADADVDARAAAHAGRLRRALHVLRDDAWPAARTAVARSTSSSMRRRVLGESHAEIVITGIHIGTYGSDIGSSLGALIDASRRGGAGGALSSVVDRGDGDRRASGGVARRRPRRASRRTCTRRSSRGSDRLLRRMGRNWYTSATYSAARRATGAPVWPSSASARTSSPDFRARPTPITPRPSRGRAAAVHVPARVSVSRRGLGRPPSDLPHPVAPAVADAAGSGASRARCSKGGGLRRPRGSAGRRTSWSIGGAGERREGLTGDYLTVLPRRRRASARALGSRPGLEHGATTASSLRRPIDAHDRPASHRLRRDVRLPDERERLRADARQARGAWL